MLRADNRVGFPKVFLETEMYLSQLMMEQVTEQGFIKPGSRRLIEFLFTNGVLESQPDEVDYKVIIHQLMMLADVESHQSIQIELPEKIIKLAFAACIDAYRDKSKRESFYHEIRKKSVNFIKTMVKNDLNLFRNDEKFLKIVIEKLLEVPDSLKKDYIALKQTFSKNLAEKGKFKLLLQSNAILALVYLLGEKEPLFKSEEILGSVADISSKSLNQNKVSEQQTFEEIKEPITFKFPEKIRTPKTSISQFPKKLEDYLKIISFFRQRIHQSSVPSIREIEAFIKYVRKAIILAQGKVIYLRNLHYMLADMLFSFYEIANTSLVLAFAHAQKARELIQELPSFNIQSNMLLGKIFVKAADYNISLEAPYGEILQNPSLSFFEEKKLTVLSRTKQVQLLEKARDAFGQAIGANVSQFSPENQDRNSAFSKEFPSLKIVDSVPICEINLFEFYGRTLLFGYLISSDKNKKKTLEKKLGGLLPITNKFLYSSARITEESELLALQNCYRYIIAAYHYLEKEGLANQYLNEAIKNPFLRNIKFETSVIESVQAVESEAIKCGFILYKHDVNKVEKKAPANTSKTKKKQSNYASIQQTLMSTAPAVASAETEKTKFKTEYAALENKMAGLYLSKNFLEAINVCQLMVELSRDYNVYYCAYALANIASFYILIAREILQANKKNEKLLQITDYKNLAYKFYHEAKSLLDGKNCDELELKKKLWPLIDWLDEQLVSEIQKDVSMELDEAANTFLPNSSQSEISKSIHKVKYFSYDFELTESENFLINILHSHGYAVFVYGGRIRDALIKRNPSDTDFLVFRDFSAKAPYGNYGNKEENLKNLNEILKKYFMQSDIIGQKNRIIKIHDFFGYELNINEISDYAFAHLSKETVKISEDNYCSHFIVPIVFSFAQQCDFTCNAMFYSPITAVLICPFGQDLRKGLALESIREPNQAFQENPPQMLRAIRLHVTCNLPLTSEVEAAIHQKLQIIGQHNPDSNFYHISKLFFNGHGLAIYNFLVERNWLHYLFPVVRNLSYENSLSFHTYMRITLKQNDLHIQSKLPISYAVIFASFLLMPAIITIRSLFPLKPEDDYYSSVRQCIREQLTNLPFRLPGKIHTKTINLLTRVILQLENRNEYSSNVSYQRLEQVMIDNIRFTEPLVIAQKLLLHSNPLLFLNTMNIARNDLINYFSQFPCDFSRDRNIVSIVPLDKKTDIKVLEGLIRNYISIDSQYGEIAVFASDQNITIALRNPELAEYIKNKIQNCQPVFINSSTIENTLSPVN